MANYLLMLIGIIREIYGIRLGNMSIGSKMRHEHVLYSLLCMVLSMNKTYPVKFLGLHRDCYLNNRFYNFVDKYGK